jgi:hypothetical protein
MTGSIIQGRQVWHVGEACFGLSRGEGIAVPIGGEGKKQKH